MHAIKGGWVGQTFALAKHNESGGKKPRIRRSKEEWKAVVESFIKKYQKVNNGNFPSVTLTHKELGGSYYTVREVVRDLIQENRVLGPAKSTSEDPSLDRFLEHSPLGSISIEPEAVVSSSNGSHIITVVEPKSYQDSSKELVLNSSVQCPESGHPSFDEENNMNWSSQVVEETEEYVKAINTDSQAVETVELDENIAELEECRADVMHLHQDVNEEQVLNSSVQGPEAEYQSFDEEKNLNGSSQVVEETGEYVTSINTNSRAVDTVELDESIAELEACRSQVTHLHQDTSEEQVLYPSVECPESEHQGIDEGKMNINGSTQVAVKTEELVQATYTESLPMETLELNENVAEQEVSAKVTHVGTDVIVETFPLRSGSKKTYGLDGKYTKQSDLDRTLVETEEVSNGSVVGDMNFTKSASELGIEEVVANVAGPLLEKSCGSVDEKPVDNLEAPVVENLDDSATKKATILGTGNGRKAEVEDANPPGTKVVVEAPAVGIGAHSLEATIKNSSEVSILDKKTASKSNPNPNIKTGSVSPKGSTPTLDRMNLESWERTSKKPAKADANPLVIFIKSFISAFAKFWS